MHMTVGDATDTVSCDVDTLVARGLKQVLSADPKPWAVWPERQTVRDARCVGPSAVRIANEFGGTEGKAVAVVAASCPSRGAAAKRSMCWTRR
jgi:hypothetical protein